MGAGRAGIRGMKAGDHAERKFRETRTPQSTHPGKYNLYFPSAGNVQLVLSQRNESTSCTCAGGRGTTCTIFQRRGRGDESRPPKPGTSCTAGGKRKYKLYLRSPEKVQVVPAHPRDTVGLWSRRGAPSDPDQSETTKTKDQARQKHIWGGVGSGPGQLT